MSGRTSGFTLLEVMVAIVVMGLILAEIGQGFTFGLHAGASQARLIDRQAELDNVDRLLRRLIACMSPGSLAAPSHPVGNDHSFLFTSELPPSVSGIPGELEDMRLAFVEGGKLQLRWSPHLHSGTPTAVVPSEETLVTGLDSLEISYLGGEAGQGWVTAWPGSSLPRRVRDSARLSCNGRAALARYRG